MGGFCGMGGRWGIPGAIGAAGGIFGRTIWAGVPGGSVGWFPMVASIGFIGPCNWFPAKKSRWLWMCFATAWIRLGFFLASTEASKTLCSGM